MTRTLLPDVEQAERRLVIAARDGDKNAFASLVTLHQGAAFRAAYLITGSAAEAEDAAQEGFVKAWLALGRFRPYAAFRPWLLRIVMNEARNRRRSAGRRHGLALRLADEEEFAPSAEEMTMEGEDRRRLLQAIGELREKDQMVIAARWLLGLSEAETAELFGWPRGTTKSRLSRALKRLREALEDTR